MSVANIIDIRTARRRKILRLSFELAELTLNVATVLEVAEQEVAHENLEGIHKISERLIRFSSAILQEPNLDYTDGSLARLFIERAIGIQNVWDLNECPKNAKQFRAVGIQIAEYAYDIGCAVRQIA